MTGSATNFLFDGTAAIKPAVTAQRIKPQIVVIKNSPAARRQAAAPKANTVGHRLVEMLRHCLRTSEMFCSLKLEDARGVAYGLFTKGNIGTIAVVGFIVAAVSIAYGA